MNDKLNELIFESVPNQGKSNELIGKLFEVTQPGAVYSEPVVSGEYTVITASEVTIAMGAGYGGGGGISKPKGRNDKAEAFESGSPVENGGVGGGGGGGGTAMGRPVAVITIGPKGVHVEPVVDPTKIALALFTAVGAMFMSLGKMRRQLKSSKP